MVIKLSSGRVLDYVPRLDPRNLAHRVTAAPTDLLQQSRYWVSGPVLNQQAEGACVGFGVTGEYMASPVRGKGDTTHGEVLARSVYHRCLQIDEFEGERDEGTSVRAGMLVGRERGWYDGFKWAFNMAELRAALETGPVVVGVEWREQMYEAPGGIVTVGGPVVGGHCLVITGYTPRQAVLKAPAYRWQNSWSRSYGANGAANIRATDLNEILFKAGGEAAVPVGRHL